MSSYSMELDYNRLLEETVNEQHNLERYVHECLIFSEGVDIYDNLCALNEGVGESIKNGWNKFIEWIKKAFAKFVEHMKRLFGMNTQWLKDHEDIIKKKPPIDFTITMPDYEKGLTNIANSPINEITSIECRNIVNIYTTLQTRNKDATLDELSAELHKTIDALPAAASINRLYREASVKEGETDRNNIKTALYSYFIGGSPKTISSDKLNMTDLYEFCYNYDKILSNIENDKKKFEASCDNISTVLTEALGKGRTAATNAAKQEAVYSQVYGKYITEAEASNVSAVSTRQVKSGTEQPANTNNAVKASTNNITSAGDDNIDKVKQAGEAIGNREFGDMGNKAFEAYIQNVRKYITDKYRTPTGDIFIAKIEAIKKIYKEYVAILVAHVRDYAGDVKTPDQVAKQSTDYTANQQTQQQAAPAN